MNALRKSLVFALLALGAAPAFAGYAVQYFVGYGLYAPPAGDTNSATPGTGLLAANGNHRALVQLIWAGPNGTPSAPNLFNAAGGYAGDDDVVLDSRILQAGRDGVDEWGYAAALPPPFVTTNSLLKPVYVRVHMDDTPEIACHWWYDSPPVSPADQNVDAPPYDVFAAVVHVETGNETPPAAGIALDQWVGPLGDPYVWCPEAPSEPQIQNLEFDPATAGSSFAIPYSYSLNAVYGAEATLPGGDWDWQPLAEGSDYVVADGVVTLATAGTGLPRFRVVRLGLIHDF